MQVERAILRRYRSESQADRWHTSDGVDRRDVERVQSVLGDASLETSLLPVAVMHLSTDRWAILQALPGDGETTSIVHAFFVDESTYAAFGYHPIQLLDVALLAVGEQASHHPRLLPILIQPASTLPIQRHLERAIERWTIHPIAMLLDCLLAGSRFAAMINDRPRSVLSALYSLLPPTCRAEFSCSGLTDHSDYPFHALLLTDEAASWSPMLQAGGVSIFDWSSDMPISTDLVHPWSQLVVRNLHDGCVERWLDFVAEQSPELTPDDLERLAQMLVSEAGESRLEFEIDATAMNPMNDFELCFQADVGSDCGPRRKHPLDLSQEDLLEQLDRLDDAAFDAIAGSDGGLSRLEALWPQVKSQLSASLVEESREQYVRLIVDQYQHSSDRDSTTTSAAFDVLKLLFD